MRLILRAFGASSAAAISMHECREEPQSGQTEKRYTDAICSTEDDKSGKFRTARISGWIPRLPTPTAATTLSATVGGIKFKISCEGLSGSDEAINEEAGKEMWVQGKGS